jgi:hypothetical protein
MAIGLGGLARLNIHWALDQHSQNHLTSDLLGYAVLLLSSGFTGPAGNSGLVELWAAGS